MSSPQALHNGLPKLPACYYCSQKKIKCDSGRPSCANCTRNKVQCSNYDSVTGDLISRARIHELEQMQRGANSGCQTTSAETPCSSSVRNNAPTAQSFASSPAVMDRGGLSFLSLLFSDANWRRSNATLLRELANETRPPEVPVQPCALPSRRTAEELFRKYLSWSHVQSAFLLRREVWDLYSRVFGDMEGETTAASEDLFRAFMICAIGSVMPFRNGTIPQHPEGYYLAALKHIDSRFLARGLRSVEDLLLICRFGIYHNIGTSIWDLIRLAGRLCIELGLHADDGGSLHTMIERQRRRRIFWHFYTIDRYSSTTLDRPFTIDDCDIHINLPADADDEEIESWGDSPNSHSLDLPPAPREPTRPTETTILLISVKLRRVSSHIHTEFCRLREDYRAPPQPHLGVGRIHVAVNHLLGELGEWRRNAPVIHNPTCLYHSQQWYDLLHAREKLYLVRRAVDLVPRKGGVLPQHFLKLLLHGALDVIEKYSLCLATSFITHTRSYFHMMFTAGLSVIFCVLYTSDMPRGDLELSSRGLESCERTLASMVGPLQHAQAYVTVFAALHRNVSLKIKRALGDVGSPPPPEDVSRSQLNTAGLPAPLSSVSSHNYTTSVQLPNTHPSANHAGYSSMETAFNGHGTGAYPIAFSHTSYGNPGAGPYAPSVTANISPLPSHNECNATGDRDLLQWAFTEDTSLWNMDTMLWEYVYGEPETAPFTSGFS